MHMVHACRWQAIARYQSDMYSLLIRLSGLLAILEKRRNKLFDMNVVYFD